MRREKGKNGKIIGYLYAFQTQTSSNNKKIGMKSLISIITLLLSFSFFGNYEQAPQSKVTDMLKYTQDNYEKEWKVIQELEEKGLPKSALVKVNELYQRAIKENNPSQVVKCVIHREKYNAQLEEDGLVKAMEGMKLDLDKADFPVSAVLKSLLGEMYNNYQRNNVYVLRDRTKISNELPTDLNTWTMEDFINESNKYFRSSVEDDRLKQVDINDFKAIMTEPKGTEDLRTSLYDFLMHRAIDNFMNAGSYLNEPAYKFYVNQNEAFADAKTFVNYEFQAKEKDSEKYQSILLFQKLLKYRMEEKNDRALLDADLKRLSFINTIGVQPNKEELYLERLQDLLKDNEGNEGYSEVAFYIASHYQSQGHKEGVKTKPWALAHDLCKKAIEKYPKSYGAKQCQNLVYQLEQKELGILVEDVNLPNENLLSKITFRNIDKAFVKIVSIPEEFLIQDRRLDNKKKLSLLNAQEVLFSENVQLPSSGDFKVHSIEFKLPSMEFGNYAIVISDRDGFNYSNSRTSYASFWVSNFAFVEKRDRHFDHDLLVVHRKTGEAMEGVKVEFYGQKYMPSSRRNKDVLLKTAYTDKDGFVPIPVGNDRGGVKPVLSKGEDRLSKNRHLYNHRSNNNLKSRKHVHFFLDRAIYRPGQNIYFKGLVYESNADGIPRILENEKVTVVFKDANYQIVEKQELTSNDFGSVQGHFIVPSAGLLGRMQLQTWSSSKSFRVEEYKRPKFEVTFDKLEGEFNLEDKVFLKGKAKAFAGYAIDNANVSYRVERTYRFPYWRYWWSYRQDPPMVIKNGIATTDEKGEFDVEFDLTPDPSLDRNQKPIFKYTVYAEVLDNTGETRIGTSIVQAGYVSLEVELLVPEKVNVDQAQEISIVSKNLNGNEEELDAEIKIEALESSSVIFRKRYWPEPDTSIYTKQVFKNHFNNYSFKGEDKIENLNAVSTVQSLKVNKGDEQTFTLDKKIKPGQYRITLNTQDKNGNGIELVKYFTAFSTKDDEMPLKAVVWDYELKNPVEAGEEFKLLLNSDLNPAYVLFEIEKKNEAIVKKWIKLDDLEELKVPVLDSDKGNFYCHLSYVHDNRSFRKSIKVTVPWSDKELKISYATFRDKLLPGQDEEWSIKIEGPQKDKVMAEFLGGMYDASLDEFASNSWNVNLFPEYYSQTGRSGFDGFNQSNSRRLSDYERRKYENVHRQYRFMNWFGFQWWNNWGLSGRMGGVVMDEVQVPGGREMKSSSRKMEKPSAPMMMNDQAMPAAVEESAMLLEEPDTYDADGTSEDLSGDGGIKKPIPVRTNLDETVFFFPALKTDEEGNVIIKFKMNEALTKWKFMGFAHTKELQFASTEKEIVTQKELMVQPNAPRFFREGDKISYTAKVINLSEKTLSGKAKLHLFDALSMEEVDLDLGNKNKVLDFNLEKGASQGLKWDLSIPFGKTQALVHRVTVEAGSFSDGEESAVPILSNRKLVTETMPLPVRAGEKRTFVFEEMKENTSSTLSHHNYTLEFTSNPAWYAVQALPYMMEYPYDCTEQVFTRMYANALASHVANDNPKVKRIFDSWKGTDALKSNLSKNEALKSALLEETPWVMDAQNEEQQKKNIGLLFDLNQMANSLNSDLSKLKERQLSNGGFAWFPGGRDSWYITQYLVEGFGHLQELGVLNLQEATSSLGSSRSSEDMLQVLRQAVTYIDARLVENYERQKPGAREYISNLQIHYLYARSFFKDVPHIGKSQKVFDHYFKLAEEKWLERSLYEQGMMALIFKRYESEVKANEIVASLKERSLNHEELGMYWKYTSGYFWYQMPIETHSLMIEVFEKVAKDPAAVDELRLWLLKNKQTNNWKTTKATASAVYALLLSGDDWLRDDKPVDVIFTNKALNMDVAEAQANAEAGTGYFKKSWKELNPQLSTVKVVNNNSVAAWGAAYWQYFEDLDKIKTFEKTPLQLKKGIFKEIKTDANDKLESINEGDVVSPGDKLIVRIELRVDRDMEYIHMKDMRASGFEPMNVFSSYKWQGGLGYYESTKDASTNFFFDFLPKGTYVFEYPMRVVHEGDFSNGITTIQCMYAPEFTSHSQGIRVKVE